MAVSGSYDFTVNAGQIVTRALQILGVLPGGTSASGDQLTDGTLHLNLILKSLQSEGLQLWRMTELVYDSVAGLTADKYKYTMGTAGEIVTAGRPEDIATMYYRDSTTLDQVPMFKLSRQEYYALSNPSTSGTPTQFYFDPQLTPALRIWPAPDSTFVASNELVIIYQKPFDDMDASTDTLAFPQSWELTIVWLLAAELSTEYGLPVQERQWIRSEADKHKSIAMAWDTEHASIFFQPSPRWRGYNA